MRLLIIDDDPHIMRALMLLFQHAGYEVLTAHNGARGLEKLLGERPDVAIIDVMMPDMTGMDMVRAWMHQKQTTDNIPFIVLSASCDDEIPEFTRNFDNMRFVPKPFSPRKILHMVQAIADAHPMDYSKA